MSIVEQFKSLFDDLVPNLIGIALILLHVFGIPFGIRYFHKPEKAWQHSGTIDPKSGEYVQDQLVLIARDCKDTESKACTTEESHTENNLIHKEPVKIYTDTLDLNDNKVALIPHIISVEWAYGPEIAFDNCVLNEEPNYSHCIDKENKAWSIKFANE